MLGTIPAARNPLASMERDTSPDNSSSGKAETVSLRDYAALERELRSLKQDFGNYRGAMSKKLSSLKNELEEVRSSDSQEPNPKGEQGENHPTESELLPIERLARLREQDKEHPALPSNGRESFERAVSIFENFKKWSDKAPSGRVIRTGLKTLLETATGEDLFWSQIQRACRMLERYSKGCIEYKKTSRHGWVLVAKDEQSVLAGRGG